MPAELSIVEGKAEMFSGNNVVPWHKQGTVVAGLLSSAEALKAAHLNWGVQKQPIYILGRDKNLIEVPGQVATVRDDNSRPLGIVSKSYQIINNEDCFDFMDSLAMEGKISYETAGALRNGALVWIMAKYDGDIDINGDKHEQWLLLVTSHDGSKVVTLLWTTVRVVCANTLSLALSEGGNQVRIKHRSNWEDKRNEAQRILGLTEEYFKQTQEALQGLNDKALTPEQMTEFTKLLFPGKDETNLQERLVYKRREVERLFQSGLGNLGATRWDAFNAVTDYADHGMSLRGPNGNRLESALMGAGQKLKQKAFNYLTNEELMRNLLERPMKVHEVAAKPQTDPDFARLIGV